VLASFIILLCATRLTLLARGGLCCYWVSSFFNTFFNIILSFGDTLAVETSKQLICEEFGSMN